jgi:hypothetical protein
MSSWSVGLFLSDDAIPISNPVKYLITHTLVIVLLVDADSTFKYIYATYFIACYNIFCRRPTRFYHHKNKWLKLPLRNLNVINLQAKCKQAQGNVIKDTASHDL